MHLYDLLITNVVAHLCQWFIAGIGLWLSLALCKRVLKF